LANPRVVQMDIYARDALAQQRFYTEVFGWSVSPAGDPQEYGWLADAGGAMFGGIGQAEGDAEPAISFFVQVDDPQAVMDAAVRLGGGIYWGPATFPNGMITGCLRDPDGNGILLIRPDRDGGPYASRPPAAADRWSWEIQSPDPERITAFYTTLFGWRIDEPNEWGWSPVDTGPDGGPGGAIARASAPCVFFYVMVDELEPYLERAQGLGVTMVVAPWEVSPAIRIAVVLDPEGNRLGLMQPTFRTASAPINA